MEITFLNRQTRSIRRKVLLALAVIGLPIPVGAQCLASVIGLRDSPLGYRLRANRCEGLFERLVSESIELRVAGFHLGWDDLKPSGKALTLEIVGQPTDSMAIRVVSMRPRVHYMMDTKAIDTSGRFVWPIDVLTDPRIDLRTGELAAIACSRNCELRTSTLWPVRLGFGDKARTLEPVLIVAANVELTDVYVTLRRGATTLWNRERFNGFFPPDRAIPIPLGSQPAGELAVEIVGLNGLVGGERLSVRIMIPERLAKVGTKSVGVDR